MSLDIWEVPLPRESEGGASEREGGPDRLHGKRPGLLAWFLPSGCLVPRPLGTRKGPKKDLRPLVLSGFSCGSQGFGLPATFPGLPATLPGLPATFAAEIPCNDWMVPSARI